jgi:Tfp pilus assembly protein PilF
MNNKGIIFYGKMQFDSALFYFTKILKYDKNNKETYASIGEVYGYSG